MLRLERVNQEGERIILEEELEHLEMSILELYPDENERKQIKPVIWDHDLTKFKKFAIYSALRY